MQTVVSHSLIMFNNLFKYQNISENIFRIINTIINKKFNKFNFSTASRCSMYSIIQQVEYYLVLRAEWQLI